MASILIVDDEIDIRNILTDILQDRGHTVFQAGNAATAVNLFQHNNIDITILDIWLEGSDLDGIGVLKKLKSMNPNASIIMISGHGNIETAVQTIKAGAYDFIEKPFKSEKLLILIDRALTNSKLLEENKKLKAQCARDFEIVGISKEWLSLKEEAKQLASSKSRVLITGEPGVGKEALTCYIHQSSDRHNKPFVKINASSLTEANFDEQFFGQVSQGILEKANGGVVMLDEVSELSPAIQPKLLKLIQDNCFIKNDHTINLDIRFISTSTYSAKELYNILNPSLYYRLNVMNLHIPPLRDRVLDIKPISEFFIKLFASNLCLNEITLEENVINKLSSYRWPGNVRQLRNMIEWLMIMYSKTNPNITLELLPNENYWPNNDNDPLNDKGKEAVIISNDVIIQPLKTARDIFERLYLKAQLDRFKGNISETAKFVGMERTALHRKLKALNVC